MLYNYFERGKKMKKLFSVLCAAVLAVSLCASSVSALGYGAAQEATYPDAIAVGAANMPVGGASVGIPEDAEPVFVKNIVSASDINFDKPVVVAAKRTMITKSALAKMVKAEKPVEFKGGNYSLILDGADKKCKTLKAINVGCSLAILTEDAECGANVIPAGAMLINLKQVGDYCLGAKLIVSADGFEGTPALYALDGTKIADVEIKDGVMIVPVTRGGRFYIA